MIGEILGEMVLRLSASALISAGAMSLAPEGRAKGAVRLACSLMCVLCLLSPLASLEEGETEAWAESYRANAERVSAEGENSARGQTRLVIERQSREYILGKAKELGEEVRVSVRAVWQEEGYFVPWEAEIEGKISGKGRLRLGYIMENDLNIPTSRQRWTDGEE